MMTCQKCKLGYVESGDSEVPAEIGGGMLDLGSIGYGYHPAYGVCGLCFLYSMFGGLLEPFGDSKAIYGIGCESERQIDPDCDWW